MPHQCADHNGHDLVRDRSAVKRCDVQVNKSLFVFACVWFSFVFKIAHYYFLIPYQLTYFPLFSVFMWFPHAIAYGVFALVGVFVIFVHLVPYVFVYNFALCALMYVVPCVCASVNDLYMGSICNIYCWFRLGGVFIVVIKILLGAL